MPAAQTSLRSLRKLDCVPGMTRRPLIPFALHWLPSVNALDRRSAEFRTYHGKGARGVVEARRRAAKHARERPHRGEAVRIEKAAQLSLAVGEVDEERTFDRVERARNERAGDRLVIGDQRTDMRGQAAVAAEQEACDAVAARGDEIRRGEAPAQAGEHRASG